MQFKKIVANWKMSFNVGKTLTYNVEIKRVKNGFDYGDNSFHSINLNGVNHKYFDTRYDGIPTTKEEWLSVWEDWLQEEWGHNKDFEIKLIDYKEEEIEVE